MTQYCLSDLACVDRLLGRARTVLIASDFDGTLCPIASSPSEVRVAPYMLEVLRSVAASSRIKLAIVSGRALQDVSRRVPIDNVIFAGNHGLEIEGGDIRFEHEHARNLRPALQNSCRELARVL